MRRFLLCLLMLLAPALAQAGAYHEEMPPCLRVTQKLSVENIAPHARIRRTYPATANDAVNAALRAWLDGMLERNRPLLGQGSEEMPAYLDVGASFSRSGVSCVSFLALCEASEARRQTALDFDTRVYDIETGRLITLGDVFPAKSEAWALLARAVDAQLRAAFPGEAPDEAALAALCTPEFLRNARFTLGAVCLTLSYRADSVYPGKVTLLHVKLYYPEIRPLMTEWAKTQTDNSRFRLVALTYDDGGARGSTRNVLDALRNGGAQATFFIIGKSIANHHDMLCRQQDAGHSVQSHTYNHLYADQLTPEIVFEEKRRFAAELAAVTGIPPAMMRAPGGVEGYYVRHQAGYPLINWSIAAGDSGNHDVKAMADHVAYGVTHGSIVLMHDSNIDCHRYTARILDSFNRRGFLCVTVEDLFAGAGVPLEADTVYCSPFRVKE